MAKPRKTAKSRYPDLQTEKQPKSTAEPDGNAAKFRWRADWIDLDGQWSFRNIDCDRLWKEVIPRLHEFESQTWGELYGKRDSSNHPMPLDKIETAAQDRLKAIDKDDYDLVFQFNIRGGIRVWGIRDRAIFYLMWYDPEHSVYIQKD